MIGAARAVGEAVRTAVIALRLTVLMMQRQLRGQTLNTAETPAHEEPDCYRVYGPETVGEI